MDYSISVDHLSRNEVLNQLQLQSHLGTNQLKKTLMARLKKCHPIWSSLKNLGPKELRRVASNVNIETKRKSDLRIEIANYFFDTSPSTPLSAFKKVAFQSYSNTDANDSIHDFNECVYINLNNHTNPDLNKTNAYSEKDTCTNKDTNTNSDALKDTYTTNTCTNKDINTDSDTLKDIYVEASLRNWLVCKLTG